MCLIGVIREFLSASHEIGRLATIRSGNASATFALATCRHDQTRTARFGASAEQTGNVIRSPGTETP
jgi:hypothetical protein